MDAWTPLVAVHATAATLALVLGAVQLLRAGIATRRHRPRGDALHRWNGRIWVGLEYLVSCTSFGIRDLSPGNFSWIHILSVITIVSLTVALVAIRRGDVITRAITMSSTYAGMLGALIGVVVVPTRLVPRAFQADWLGMSLLTLAITGVAVGGVLLLSLATRRTVRGSGDPA